MDALFEAVARFFAFCIELLLNLFQLFGIRITILLIAFIGLYFHGFQLKWVLGYIILAIVLYSPFIYRKLKQKQ